MKSALNDELVNADSLSARSNLILLNSLDFKICFNPSAISAFFFDFKIAPPI